MLVENPDQANQVLQTIVTQLPNFAGLFISLAVVLRQNMKLTDALIDMTNRCDCRDKDERVARPSQGPHQGETVA